MEKGLKFEESEAKSAWRVRRGGILTALISQAVMVDHNIDRHGPGRDPGSIMEMCVSVVA